MKVKGNGGGDFQKVEPGTHLATCIKVVDIGTQYGEYQGKPTARRQVILEWELPNELVESGEAAGQPLTIRKFYTASLNEKATLRHDLVNWRGRDFTPEELNGFELSNVLGIPCLVTVTETDSGGRKITGVTKPPKGTKMPQQVNPSVSFDLDEFDGAVYQSLSEWLQETIAKSPEYAEILAAAGKVVQPTRADLTDVDFGGDDIPF